MPGTPPQGWQDVVSLPMRDGNQKRRGEGSPVQSVVSLPMRDGNTQAFPALGAAFTLLAYL